MPMDPILWAWVEVLAEVVGSTLEAAPEYLGIVGPIAQFDKLRVEVFLIIPKSGDSDRRNQSSLCC